MLAEDKDEEKPKSTLLQHLPVDEVIEPSRPILEAKNPALRPTGEEERTPYYIYFPPNPPPLGVDARLDGVDTRVGAPTELAPHILEPFYAPLSTQVIERGLSRTQRAALASYEAKRRDLLEALRRRLDELAAVDATSRRVALEELAARQAPELAALEREADRLRGDFIRFGASWYSLRGWKLGRSRLDLPREQTLFLEYQLLRAAAFYQEGLSPPQRRLLREIALELEAHVFPGSLDNTGGDGAAADWFWFFLPHLARIHLPDDLPRDLQEMIATWREEKDALKRELRDAIYDHDRVVFESTRVEPLQALASTQAPRLEKLEHQADLIRKRLALVSPQVSPPAPPPLPAELEALIETYEREKRALERELADRVRRAVRHMIVPDNYMPHLKMRAWRETRLETMANERQRFLRDRATELAALRARQQELRAAIEAFEGPEATAHEDRSSSRSFVADFLDGRRRQQGQREYHLAVFEPGLSPEQRRLLFAAAVTAMNLPLPGPEKQPTSLPGTLLK